MNNFCSKGAQVDTAPLLSVLPEESGAALQREARLRAVQPLLRSSDHAFQQTRERHAHAEQMQALSKVYTARALHEGAFGVGPQLQLQNVAQSPGGAHHTDHSRHDHQATKRQA